MKIGNFGIAVSNLNLDSLSYLQDLNVDVVQIPIHFLSPSLPLLDELISAKIRVIGKYIPPKNHKPSSFFYRDLFQKYKDRIKIWDFGGEPETRPDQPGCRWFGSSLEFSDALKAFYETGKIADPENSIGAGGFVSATFNGNFGNEDRSWFLREIFQDGPPMDFCSVNLFSSGYGGRKNIIAGIQTVKVLLAEFGFLLPIIVSEMGVPCSGNPGFYHIIQSERGQALHLIQNFMLQISLSVVCSIWFTLSFQGWGLVSPSKQKREAYFVYHNLIKLLKNAKFVGQLKTFPEPERFLTDSVEWYKFETRDKEIHLAFIKNGKLERPFPPGVTIFGMFGKEIIGKNIWFSELPIFLITSKGAHPEQCLRD